MNVLEGIYYGFFCTKYVLTDMQLFQGMCLKEYNRAKKWFACRKYIFYGKCILSISAGISPWAFSLVPPQTEDKE